MRFDALHACDAGVAPTSLGLGTSSPVAVGREVPTDFVSTLFCRAVPEERASRNERISASTNRSNWAKGGARAPDVVVVVGGVGPLRGVPRDHENAHACQVPCHSPGHLGVLRVARASLARDLSIIKGRGKLRQVPTRYAASYAWSKN